MALAIAHGVVTGTDLGEGKGKTITVKRTKTTMPQAVTALVEEALVSLVNLYCCTLFVAFVLVPYAMIHFYPERFVSSCGTCSSLCRAVIEVSKLRPRG